MNTNNKIIRELITFDSLLSKIGCHGKLLLRVGLGLMFVLYGLMKFSYLDGTIGYFTSLFGPSFGPSLAYLVSGCELVLGVMLILGAFTRVSALILGIILTVAVLRTLTLELMVFAKAGPALQVVALALGCYALVFIGGGKLSIDALLTKKTK